MLASTSLKTTTSANTIFKSQKHPFHILDASPYPFLTGLFLATLLLPLTFSMHGVDILGLPAAELVHASFFGLFLTAMA